MKRLILVALALTLTLVGSSPILLADPPSCIQQW